MLSNRPKRPATRVSPFGYFLIMLCLVGPANASPVLNFIDNYRLEVDDVRNIDASLYSSDGSDLGTVTISVDSSDSSAVTAEAGTVTRDGSVYRFTLAVTALAVETVTVSVQATDANNRVDTRTFTVWVFPSTLGGTVLAQPVILPTISEEASGEFTVALSKKPRRNVTVAVTSGDSGVATVSPTVLNFTTTDWSTSQPVTVTGVRDSDTEDDIVIVSVEPSGGGYTGSDAQVWVTVEELPGAPASPAVRPGNSRVTLLWAAPAAGGAPVSWQYRQRLAGLNSWPGWLDMTCGSALCAGDTVQYVVSGLTNNNSYQFQWRAVNASGGAGPAAEAITATLDLKPTGFVATAGDRQAALAWHALSGVTGWQYRQKAGAGDYGGWTDIAGSSATTASHTVTGLTARTAYGFQIRARLPGDVFGAESDEATATPATGLAPDFGTATIADRQFDQHTPITSLTLPAATGGNGALSYSLTPDVPPGLTLDTATRAITGAPTTVQAATSYSWTATDDDGDAASLSFAIAVNYRTAPPTGFAAVPGDGQIALSWDAHPDIDSNDHYIIQYKKGTTPEDLEVEQGRRNVPLTGSNTSFLLTGLDNGEQYVFGLVAFDGQTNSVSPYAIVFATPFGKPAKPTGVVATPGFEKVRLTWSAIGGVSNWEYRRRSAGGAFGAWTAIAGSNDATVRHLVTGLVNGTAHEFQLRAVRGGVAGLVSDTVSATPTDDLPSAPTGFVAVAGEASASLVWQPPTDVLFDKQQLRWKPVHLLPFTTGDSWTDLAADVASHSVAGLTNGILYRFELRAATVRGAGPAAGADAAPAIVAPGKPWGLRAEAGDGTVSLSWLPIAIATGWQYRQKQGAGAFGAWIDIAGSGARTASHDVTGLTNGETYAFRVRAMRSGVNGPVSDEVEAMPAMTPTGFFAIASQTVPDVVNLRWTASANDAISGWQYQLAAGTSPFGTDWIDIPGSGAATRAHAVSDLAVGTTWRFRVRAVIGDAAQQESAEKSATPQALSGWLNFKTDGCSATLPANSTGVTLTRNGGPVEIPVALFADDCTPMRDHGTGGSDWDKVVAISLQWQDTGAVDVAIPGFNYRTYSNYNYEFIQPIVYKYGEMRIRLSPGATASTASFRVRLDDYSLEGDAGDDRFERVHGLPVTLVGNPLFAADAGIADRHYALNKTIVPPALPAATGGEGKLTYTISPALPAGLVFDGDGDDDLGLDAGAAPTLTGAPGAIRPWTVYTLTVHDADSDRSAADSDSIDFRLRVNAPPAVANAVADRTVLLGATETVELASADSPVFGDLNADDVLNIVAVSDGDEQTDPPVTVTRSGSRLSLTGAGEGVNEITLYAIDLGGAVAADSFRVESIIPTLALSGGPLALAEGGGDGSFTVALSHPPTGDVTVAVAGGDGARALPASLHFTSTNWSAAQTVTVSPADDPDAADESLAVTLTASGTTEYASVTGSVAVTVADDETAGLAVIGGPLALAEGGDDGSFTVALSHPPRGDVTVAVAGGDGARASPASLLFTATNWNAAQKVTVSPADDPDAADESLTVALTASGATEFASVTGSVAVTVADDETAGLAVTGGPLALEEGGGDGSFTVALSHPPTGDVTVAVAGGDGARALPASLYFTSTNWSAAQTVTVSPADDPDAADESLTVALTASGATEYGSVEGSVAVTVADDETAGLTVTGGPLALAEGGGDGSFTVALSHPPTGDVTVAVAVGDGARASPASLGFTSTNWSAAQTVTVSPADDPDAADESLTVALTASGAREYASVTGSVAVTVADDETAGLTIAGGPLALAEGGGDGSFTVALSHPPRGDVTVSVAGGDGARASPASLGFTSTNWSVAQTVTVSPADDPDAADESLTVSLTASGATEYASVEGSVAVTVADDETAGLTVTGGPLALAEGGGDGSFTVALSHPPTGDVTVSVAGGDGARASPASLGFTAANWSAAQTVTVSPADDPDAADESLTVSLTASGATEYASVEGSVAVTVADDETAGLTVTGGPLALAEGGGDGSFTVALSHPPTGDVTVSVAGGDGARASPASLGFTAANWSAAQTVTVSPADDPDAADESLTVSLTASGATEYASVEGSVAVTVADDETAGLAIAGGPLALAEGGGDGSFTVALSHPPTGDVTVAVAGGDGARASPASLGFTAANWNVAQTVTVSPADDPDAADESLTVSLTASGATEYGSVTGSVAVTVADDETAGLTVAGAPLALSEGGGDGSFTVALSHPPTGDVTVSVSGGDGAAALPASLYFTSTNWSAAQTVTVSPADDPDAADESLTVALTASGATEYASVTGSVAVTVADDETAGLTVTGGPLALAEGGGDGSFTVALSHPPTGDVTVAVAGGDGARASPASLGFTSTNWSAAQTVTVSPADDPDAADESLTVALTASGAAEYASVEGSVAVTVADDETAGLTIAGGPLALEEGGGDGSFTVALSHPPRGDVTVAVAVGDGARASPASLRFTAANWSAAQTVTVSPADDPDAADESLTVALTASGATEYGSVTGSVAVTVADDETAGLTVTGGPLALAEGGDDGTFTVALSHPPRGEVTVSVAGGDGARALPASLRFTATNWSAAQTVTVSPADDPDAADESLTVALTASGATEYGSVTGSVAVTVADDETAGLTVAGGPLALAEGGGDGSFTVALSHPPRGEVTVSVAGGDGARALPASLRFTATNWSAAQTVTVSPADDPDAADESLTVALTASGATEYGSVTGSVAVTVADDETAGLTVTGGPLALAEGGGDGSFTVALSHPPTGDVTVSVAGGDGATALPASLRFTATNWSVAQTVTVSPADDPDAADESLTVALTASGATEYASVEGSVAVTVADDETAGLTVTGGPLALAEGGGDGSFTVALSHPPRGDVTVSVAGGDGATALPASLRFTAANWSAAQTVTVSPADDPDAADESLTVALTANGATEYASVTGSVSVTVADDETAGLAVAEGPLALAEGGGDGSFTVALSHPPTDDVTVSVAGGEGAAALPASLRFTAANWSAAQTVTVSPADDPDAADESLAVALTASGATEYASVTGSVAVTVTDDETAGLTVTGGPLALAEGGGDGSFTVALSHPPTGDVTVAVTGGDGATALPASLRFTATNWSAAQTVTVSPADDPDAADESLTVTLAASGATEYASVTGSVAVTVADDEEPVAPEPVIGLTAVPGDSEVRLSWVDPDDGRITGYQYRYGIGASVPPSVPWTAIAGSGPRTTSYRVAGLRNGSRYTFEVRAVSAVEPSAPSSASATPQAGARTAARKRIAQSVLAEVARATLADAADTVARRLQAAPGETLLTLAGQDVTGASALVSPALSRSGEDEPETALAGFWRHRPGSSYAIDDAALLRDSAFTLSLGDDASGVDGLDWTVWGRGDGRRFSGRNRQDSWDGENRAIWFGGDFRQSDRLLAGLAVSQSLAEIDYRTDDDRGTLETSLTTLWPYLQLASKDASLQIVAGVGDGAVEHRPEGEAADRADLRMRAAAIGGRRPFMRLGGLALSATGDAGLARLQTGAFSLVTAGRLRATAWRVKGGVEAAHDGVPLFGGDWLLVPQGTLSLRRDGGDGASGAGVETMGGVRILGPGSRFAVDANGRWLTLHSASDMREWGASVGMRLEPGAGGRGLSVSLAHDWGEQQGGALLGEDVFDLETVPLDRAPLTALGARMGYGFGVRGGLLTPFADVRHASGWNRTQSHRAGIEFAAPGGVAAGLIGESRTEGAGDPERRSYLRLDLRF